MLNSTMDNFDKRFNRMQNFMYGWFVFVALVAVSILSFGGFCIYKILAHFGIL